MFSEVFASFAGRQVRVIFDWSMNGKMLQFQSEDMIELDCDISSPMALEGATATQKPLMKHDIVNLFV